MQTVALIDYGSGNLRSVERALVEAARRNGIDCEVLLTPDPDVVRRADRVLLPGVGAFASCRAGLAALPGMTEALTDAVLARGAPFLGVCVGMQLLATRGLEFGETAGLDWIPGVVRRLEPADGLTVPHMGWNDVTPAVEHPLLDGAAPMYFANSFAFDPDEPGDVAALSDHGGPFTAMVARENIAGVQFHPEKSQAAGLALLASFLRWRP
jgi:glutamine amidotransferase